MYHSKRDIFIKSIHTGKIQSLYVFYAVCPLLVAIGTGKLSINEGNGLPALRVHVSSHLLKFTKLGSDSQSLSKLKHRLHPS